MHERYENGDPLMTERENSSFRLTENSLNWYLKGQWAESSVHNTWFHRISKVSDLMSSSSCCIHCRPNLAVKTFYVLPHITLCWP